MLHFLFQFMRITWGLCPLLLYSQPPVFAHPLPKHMVWSKHMHICKHFSLSMLCLLGFKHSSFLLYSKVNHEAQSVKPAGRSAGVSPSSSAHSGLQPISGHRRSGSIPSPDSQQEQPHPTQRQHPLFPQPQHGSLLGTTHSLQQPPKWHKHMP